MATASSQPGSMSSATLAGSPAPSNPPNRSDAFTFPTYTSFPPFYTLQPNITTRARQLTLWSQLVLSYCSHHRIFRLPLSSLPPDLFTNRTISRSLSAADTMALLTWMSLPENQSRVEWVPPAAKGEKSSACWVLWRSLGEWADVLYGWVEETGQKGSVLTVYELREGEAIGGREWVGMDEELLQKVLGVIVKRGKAQIFGQEESAGVKFF
ncbi:hypothetical protein MBLNU230_g6599t1 [Neophaeotheca triangularis]